MRPPLSAGIRNSNNRRRSVGSFDVSNVYPSTSNSKGAYSDPKIAAAIKESNYLVNSGKVKPSPPGGAAPVSTAAGQQGQGQPAGGQQGQGALKALQGFPLFERLVLAAGLGPALGNPATRATIFAPTDAVRRGARGRGGGRAAGGRAC